MSLLLSGLSFIHLLYTVQNLLNQFALVCRKASQEDIAQLVVRIKDNVAESGYSCSIGYSYRADKEKSIDTLLKESDEMMYADKAEYYSNFKRDRRRR